MLSRNALETDMALARLCCSSAGAPAGAASPPPPPPHRRGDEVETDCWDEDAASVAWMKAHGLNASETYVRFVNANVNLTTAQSKRAVVWNDLWRDYGTAGPSAAVGGVSADAAIMFWTSNPGSFQAAADDGRDVIAASGGPYYLSNR